MKRCRGKVKGRGGNKTRLLEQKYKRMGKFPCTAQGGTIGVHRGSFLLLVCGAGGRGGRGSGKNKMGVEEVPGALQKGLCCTRNPALVKVPAGPCKEDVSVIVAFRDVGGLDRKIRIFYADQGKSRWEGDIIGFMARAYSRGNS